MRKQIYKTDSSGFISEIFIGEFDVPGNLIKPLGKFVTTDLPQPLHLLKPRWDGKEWVEGATQEEIDELTKPIDRPLTDTEVLGQQMTERELEAMLQGQQITDLELRMMMLEMGAN